MSVQVTFRGGRIDNVRTTLIELRPVVQIGDLYYGLTSELDGSTYVYEHLDGANARCRALCSGHRHVASCTIGQVMVNIEANLARDKAHELATQRYVFVPDPEALPKHEPCTSLKPTHDTEGHTMLLRILWYLGWVTAPPVALFGAVNTALGGFMWDASWFWGGVLTLIFGVAGTVGMWLWLDDSGRPEIAPKLPKEEVRKDRELRRQLEVDAMRERGEIVREARRTALAQQNAALEAKLGMRPEDQPAAIEPSAIHDPEPHYPHHESFPH